MTRLGVSERLDRWPTLWVGAITLIMAAVAGWADLLAGTDVSVTLFFLLPISTCWSSLPLSRSPHFSFLPLQASILPLVTDPSPCPALTMLIDLFILRPYLSTNSFFLYSVSQSFSVSNTKIHDCWCWVLILLP